LRRALVGLFAGGRAEIAMAEEAEAAAEVGKAIASLAEGADEEPAARDSSPLQPQPGAAQ
jgi:hypothetical protein